MHHYSNIHLASWKSLQGSQILLFALFQGQFVFFSSFTEQTFCFSYTELNFFWMIWQVSECLQLQKERSTVCRTRSLERITFSLVLEHCHFWLRSVWGLFDCLLVCLLACLFYIKKEVNINAKTQKVDK